MKRADYRKTWILRLAPLALLALAVPACAGRLQHVSVGASGGVTTLKLSADTPMQFSDFSLSDPDRIVVDCINTDGALQAPTFSDDLVREVNFVHMTGDHGPTTRMIVSLKHASEYTISQKQTALEVSIQRSDVKSSAGLVDAVSASHIGHVTLDVQGADVKTVLRTLSEASGRNIVPSKDVRGEVSISLHNVAWREALEVLCKSQALAYKEENGIIRVGPVEQIQNEELAQHTAERKGEELLPLETRTVHVTFAHVEELKATLAGTLSTRGHLDADGRTSTLVITDIASRAEQAEKLALKLDSRTPQIQITAKLIDVDASESRDLGVTWNSAKASGTLNGSADFNNGIAEGAGTSVRIGTISPDNNVFNLRLQALERERKADIISNPTITTVDNREARILVGQKIPLIVADAAGNAITQLTTIGIQLKVTPHLNTDNKITMDVHPEVSDLSSQSTVQGGVIINTSEADTRVQVDDGQTAVIGGLIRTNESHSNSGVPVLMDIPLIGGLFRSHSIVKQKRELMILITPHLVNGTPGQ